MRAPPPIVSVSLNAAIDRTAGVGDFTLGAVNRVAWERSDAGGKGVNVAACLADLGHPVAVTGLLGAENPDLFEKLFFEKAIVDRFVRVPGRTRVNVKIVDDSRRITEIDFPGVTATSADLAAVAVTIEDLAGQGAEWFVLSGSLPTGLAPETWRDLTALLKARGCKVLLDTSGAALARAIDAGADVLKPNIAELRELVGRALDREVAIVDAARDLLGRGSGLVAVSMGERGAIFVDAETAIHAAPPSVEVKSTVGAGDAMVAGILHARLRGFGIEESARYATALAVGAVGRIGPRLPTQGAVEDLRERVATRRITI